MAARSASEPFSSTGLLLVSGNCSKNPSYLSVYQDKIETIVLGYLIETFSLKPRNLRKALGKVESFMFLQRMKSAGHGVHACNPSLKEAREGNCLEFETNLAYIERPVWERKGKEEKGKQRKKRGVWWVQWFSR